MKKNKNVQSRSRTPKSKRGNRGESLTESKGPTPARFVMDRARFQRTIYDNGAYTQGVPAAGFARAFQLDELPGYTDFTTLYDQYRFTRVDYRLIPRCNTNTLTTQAVAGTAVMPTINVWWDPDDATTPSLVGESLEVENATYNAGYEIIEGSFTPHAAIAAYGGAFTQFANFKGWCDCTSDDIEWYALKVWVGAGGGAQTTFQIWDAFYTIHAEFRKVR